MVQKRRDIIQLYTTYKIFMFGTFMFSVPYHCYVFADNSKVPSSCCRENENLDLCMGTVEGVGPPSVGPPITIDPSTLNYTLYTTVCVHLSCMYICTCVYACIDECPSVHSLFVLL